MGWLCWAGLSRVTGHRKRHTDVQGLRMRACGGLVRRILRAGAPDPAVLGPVSGRHVSTRRVVLLSECTRESRGQCERAGAMETSIHRDTLVWMAAMRVELSTRA